MPLPSVIGVIGVGTISSACAALAAEFPESVTVAASNQAVLDACDAVLVAVLPDAAEAVLGALGFDERHAVVSLVSSLPMEDLERWTAPAQSRAIAMPLPVVARRRGVTLVTPTGAEAEAALAIFEPLGSAVAVDDPADFRRLQAMTCVMGDLYQRQATMLDWLVRDHGVDARPAAAYVGALVHSMTLDSAHAGPETFDALVDEQTPGGMNEMVVREQREDGSYDSLKHSLDSVHSRLTGAHDPNLAPTKKRKR